MDFISTRGKVGAIGFVDSVLMGLADDGGLLVPEQIPHIPIDTLNQWSKLSYTELALEIFSLYIGEDIPRTDLKKLVDASYATFRHPEVTPVRSISNNEYVLELFHGPTFAFKDIALQFLGNLYAYISQKRNISVNIVGATSGDTGASAIEGVRGKEGIRICILHPSGKVSKVQELQMTTIHNNNVLNLAVDGNFDDCQRIIKELFADVDFKHRYHLRAINSINIARILAQTVYYFYAYFRLAQDGTEQRINFSVPTGNFGDIFAGYMSKQMGLPINRLILATNENNILERFVTEGVYQPGEFRSTHSPSMDIQVASNFERYLYYLYQEDAGAVVELMNQFKTEGKIEIPADKLAIVQRDFAAYGVKNQECLDIIAEVHSSDNGYLLDPHTACGVVASGKRSLPNEITVTLATAHPSKFNESIELVGIRQELPTQIQKLLDKPQYQTEVGSSNEEIAAQLEAFFQA